MSKHYEEEFKKKIVRLHLEDGRTPVFDTKINVKASQHQHLCGLWGFLKILQYTLRIRFFRLCTNIFHFFDRNDFLRCVKVKRIM